MATRIEPAADPVHFEHDGETVTAARGEALAIALIAANRLPIARSPKLHRPRSPYCLRGACDGCLARVDGVPNVMTCRLPARGGERVETQNVLGSRGMDVLRATDFLFPRGIDHHRLFAGIRGVSGVVQRFARRVAGLGRLPAKPRATQPARRREVEVLIVGGGAAGVSAALELAGRDVLLVDDGLELGGSTRALDPRAARRFQSELAASRVDVRTRSTVAALYREPNDRLHALLDGVDGAELIVPRAVLVASGCHDAVACFENNDLPGVMSARAGLLALRHGVLVGEKIGLLGAGRFATRVKELAEARELWELSAIESARGRSRVSGALAVVSGARRRLNLDAILVDQPGAPSCELLSQAGAQLEFRGAGYFPLCSADALATPGVWCAGSVRGAADSARDGEGAARALCRALG